MTILDAIILGIVEGITEYLPVSSTGHLVITSALLGLDSGESADSVNALLIVIQGGAILAVLGLYWSRVQSMIMGLLGRDREGLRLFITICIAFAPAALIGPFVDDWIEAKLMHPVPVLIALAGGGILMIFIGRGRQGRGLELTQLSLLAALLIGLMQLLAMWPGVSRSMITIVAGMAVGLRASKAAEFSFLLGLPTLGGACAFKLMKNLSGEGPNLFQELGWLNVAIGVIVATISAAIAVRWLVNYLNRHGLAVFGWYRIGLTILLAVLLMTGVMTLGQPPAPS
ncbi:MAG: undecaprenyl-diphosphate phosphatase [Phycisphaerales bacterium]|nr:UDP-diphosphatase [Phycisphaerae bacterium]MCH2152525.1 undecaprenyl-diphosphate phosphatase [Phycisphaerales bacterium]|tara:strand:+ start:709 stop:1563 length:855 start_codon:yes stop_codon:yes gene_type:complete